MFGVAGAPVVDDFTFPAAFHERMALVVQVDTAAVCLAFFDFEADVDARVEFIFDDKVIVLLKDETLLSSRCEL